MKYPGFTTLLVVVLGSSLMLFLGLYLLANFKRLFRHYIKNEFLRQNIVVWMIAVCLILSVSPTNPELYHAISSGKWLKAFLTEIVAITIMTFFVFNVMLLVLKNQSLQKMSFRRRMGIILFTIIACTMITGIPINYLGNSGSFKNVDLTLVFNFYTGCMTGLIYVTMNYVDLERQKKLNEKELEVSRLQQLKTNAELEALHSKINPHFLYNALNSIADLSITDGKKARKMTIALADLFRFSLNYSNNNYSTVKDEVEMAEVYLQIEKIRFEDKLNYSIDVDEELNYYLVPRFILQPIVENAVKHGLKATGRLIKIALEIKKSDDGLIIMVADTGPGFPDELNPGIGVKSIFDKLDLLFPGAYEFRFSNQPRKQVSISLKKLIKNEPGIQGHNN
jgi:two-component system LytT family sensor kinase